MMICPFSTTRPATAVRLSARSSASAIAASTTGRGPIWSPRRSGTPPAPAASVSTASVTSSSSRSSSASSTPVSACSRFAPLSITCAPAASRISPRSLSCPMAPASSSAHRPTRSSTSCRADRVCSASLSAGCGAKSKALCPSCPANGCRRMMRPSRRWTNSPPAAPASSAEPTAALRDRRGGPSTGRAACSICGVLPLFPTSKSPGLSSLISVADDEVLLNTNLPPEHDVRAAAFGLGQRLVLLGGLLAGLRPGTAATAADVLRPQCSVEQRIEGAGDLLGRSARPGMDRARRSLGLLHHCALGQRRIENERAEHLTHLLDPVVVFGRTRTDPVDHQTQWLQVTGAALPELIGGPQGDRRQ